MINYYKTFRENILYSKNIDFEKFASVAINQNWLGKFLICIQEPGWMRSFWYKEQAVSFLDMGKVKKLIYNARHVQFHIFLLLIPIYVFRVGPGRKILINVYKQTPGTWKMVYGDV